MPWNINVRHVSTASFTLPLSQDLGSSSPARKEDAFMFDVTLLRDTYIYK